MENFCEFVQKRTKKVRFLLEGDFVRNMASQIYFKLLLEGEFVKKNGQKNRLGDICDFVKIMVLEKGGIAPRE